MNFNVISFDLQGTLSDSAFSDEFWLKLLPELYAGVYAMSVGEAKALLKDQFARLGRYDRRYYCARYWRDLICPDTLLSQLFARLTNAPRLFEDTLEFVREISDQIPLIVLSTTTHDFMEVELNGAARYFRHVYSTLDDFDTPGKTPALFTRVARELAVPVDKLLHIGDCAEMDVANAQAAGCAAFFFDKKLPRSQTLSSLRKEIGLCA